jgi:hypothetical protein
MVRQIAALVEESAAGLPRQAVNLVGATGQFKLD